MRLYNATTSVCSIKVRLCLAEIGLGYEEDILDLQAGDQFSPAYRTLNPDAVVPTLVDKDLVVVESSLIIEYLDRVYNGRQLMPDDPALEVAVRRWLLRCLDVHAAVNTLTFATIGRDRLCAGKSAAEIEASLAQMPNRSARMKRRDLIEKGVQSEYVVDAVARFDRVFADLSATLASHLWISGPVFGLADIALLAYTDRLERMGFEGFWSNQPLIADWLARMQARPSYAKEVKAKLGPALTGKMRADARPYWEQIAPIVSQIGG